MSARLKWALLVGAFLIVALVAMIVGFRLAGFDILAWFSSKYAMIVYIVLGLYAFFVAYVLIMEYLQK